MKRNKQTHKTLTMIYCYDNTEARLKRNKQIHKALTMIFCSDNAEARLEYVQAHWNNNKESGTNLTFYFA